MTLHIPTDQPDWHTLFAGSIAAMNPPPGFLALAAKPGLISFAGGVPDAKLFPAETLAASYQRILNDPEKRQAALQYAPSTGLVSLRRKIAANMQQTRKTSGNEDNILITNGAQQALDLIAKLFIDPGDLIAVTGPTFFAALDTFNAYQPEIATIDLDERGLDMAGLRRVLAQRPKFIYLIPDFQNPTGLSIPLEQRREVVRLARAHGVAVIEDAAYDRLAYDGQSVAGLAGLAQEAVKPVATAPEHQAELSHVIHVNTFSKVIVPGMRIGWVHAASGVISRLAALKLASDIHSSILTQMVVEDFIDHALEDHIAFLCTAYRRRRDAMLTALERFMPETVCWTRPQGGLFIWLSLPAYMDATELLHSAIEDYKTAFVPGALSHPDGRCRNALRLSFATASSENIKTGINRLAGLINTRLVANAA